MLANELISEIVDPLRTSDTGEEALTIMQVYHIKHLPIVNNKTLLGTISEEDILNHDLDEPLGSYQLSLNKGYVHHNDHLFEVMAKFAQLHLTAIPVTDEDEAYLGLITQEDLIQFYAKSFSFTEPGSIIVLEMDKVDYSLAEISRIVEGESVAILSCFLTRHPEKSKVFVTLKINKQEISRPVATLERHGFLIKASFAEEGYMDNLKERYDALMHYLNV